MYFITTKRMLEVCFSAHPNIQYRTLFSCRHFVHILLYTVPFPTELIPSGLSRPPHPVPG